VAWNEKNGCFFTNGNAPGMMDYFLSTRSKSRTFYFWKCLLLLLDKK